MSSSRLEGLSVRQLAEWVASRRLSVAEVTAYFLERIARFDEQLRGYNHVAADRAMAAARELDARIARGDKPGALAGIPISVKDIVDVEGLPATGASATRKGRIASSDATVVRRLRRAGAIVLGMANCHELAFGGPSFDLPCPPARNPWNTDFFSGGSSSGSGVTVAAGLCLGSVATDTAGSIRLPATLCGVVGLKPTHGALPLDGISPLSLSMDHVGPIAATVDDCRILFAAMRGESMPEPLPPEASFSGLHLGIPRNAWGIGDRLDADMGAAWQEAIAVARSGGATIVELDLEELETFHAPAMVVMMREVADVHAAKVRRDFSSYGEMFRGRVLIGDAIDEKAMETAGRARVLLTEHLSRALETVDAILAPGALTPATLLRAVNKYYFMKDPIPNAVAAFTGHPALAFPCGLSSAKLPVGVQLIGLKGAEERLFDIAARFLQARPDWSPRPVSFFEAA
ncbi:amidase [Chelativorans sp.]|uniref:amidase n=1 Tax=Chelativorans sp. TaxID=2203393 RepID=UPI002811E89C|nr:amidase [Chelativorans sp.]